MFYDLNRKFTRNKIVVFSLHYKTATNFTSHQYRWCADQVLNIRNPVWFTFLITLLASKRDDVFEI